MALAWAHNVQLALFKDDHLLVGLLSIIGLVLWSLGVPVSFAELTCGMQPVLNVRALLIAIF